MLAKLEELSQSKSYKSAWLSTFGAKRDLQGFLARRCSKEFLSLYLQQQSRSRSTKSPNLDCFSTPFRRCA